MKSSISKVAVVTGGASGIGEACARRFARDGYRIAVLDRNEALGEAVAASIREAGGQANFHAVDVADRTAQDAIARTIEEQAGPVGVLVTSAGILDRVATLLDVDLDHHARVWDVNYHGTLHSIRAFAPAMVKRGAGAICTVGSVNSFVGLPLPAYNPAKAAVMRLTELAAMELGRAGVRINGVAPNYTLTPAFKAKIAAGERDPENIRRSGALHMLIEPEHVASAVAFLCSEEAAVITGHMLPVDCGYLVAAHYQSFAGGMPWKA